MARQKGRPSSRSGVGYGRPPKHSQFKPGQSGNPAGRKKVSVSPRLALLKALAEKVHVTVNGHRREISKHDLAYVQFVNKAASGNERVIPLLMKLLMEIEEKPDCHPMAPEPGGGVVIYLPAKGGQTEPVGFNAIETPLESLTEQIEKNERKLAKLTAEERKAFFKILAKLMPLDDDVS